MKMMMIRSLATGFVLAAAACSAPVPTEPDAAAPASISQDESPTPPADTTARGPNLFGSGN